MKLFEIQIINRYYEEKEYASEIITANSEKEALINFAKRYNIKDYKYLFQPLFSWENGMWMSSFKNIKEVQEIICSHCNGTGIVFKKK